MNKETTSWENVHRWYDDLVGPTGHYYHEHVVLPNSLKLLQLQENSSLLDLGCGQGILARKIPKQVGYTGLDISSKLIQAAKSYSKHPFIVHDITKPFPIPSEQKFSHAACLLAIQNIEAPENVFRNVAPYLLPKSKLLLVMNHPSFRIPRQSNWGFDEAAKLQYRKINCYMSPQKIPIQMNPGKSQEVTWSFHYPLSSYSDWLRKNGFYIEKIEEWCSDKQSTGKAARWENRARKEFPLFLAILATKAV
jgi:SAM-dependent methyltransferase